MLTPRPVILATTRCRSHQPHPSSAIEHDPFISSSWIVCLTRKRLQRIPLNQRLVELEEVAQGILEMLLVRVRRAKQIGEIPLAEPTYIVDMVPGINEHEVEN